MPQSIVFYHFPYKRTSTLGDTSKTRSLSIYEGERTQTYVTRESGKRHSIAKYIQGKAVFQNGSLRFPLFSCFIITFT